MRIGRKYKFADVYDRHWLKLADAIGVRPDFMKRQIHILANDIAKASTRLFGELINDTKLTNRAYEKVVAVIALHHKLSSDPIVQFLCSQLYPRILLRVFQVEILCHQLY